MAASKAGLNSQAYSELQLAVANLQAQIDGLGGGMLRTEGFSGVKQIASGSAIGVLATIVPPSAEHRVVITTLGPGPEPGVTIIGDVQGDYFTGKTLSTGSNVDVFTIGRTAGTSIAANAGTIETLKADKGETVTIEKLSGAATTSIIYYAYHFEIEV